MYIYIYTCTHTYVIIVYILYVCTHTHIYIHIYNIIQSTISTYTNLIKRYNKIGNLHKTYIKPFFVASDRRASACREPKSR